MRIVVDANVIASAVIHVSRDPDDDKFISCAVDGKCLYIVSGDGDLLSIVSYADIEILTVADFLNRREKSKEKPVIVIGKKR